MFEELFVSKIHIPFRLFSRRQLSLKNFIQNENLWSNQNKQTISCKFSKTKLPIMKADEVPIEHDPGIT